ncbi:hypothetical protein C8K15_12242 [Paenisporosarcina sp. OV554]|nr:hypothetical protein C8K15_12242 [Paenisporosarcina sp. OV554]
MVWNPANPVGKDEIENRNEDKVNQCLLSKSQSFHFEYHGCYCEKPATKQGTPCIFYIQITIQRAFITKNNDAHIDKHRKNGPYSQFRTHFLVKMLSS